MRLATYIASIAAAKHLTEKMSFAREKRKGEGRFIALLRGPARVARRCGKGAAQPFVQGAEYTQASGQVPVGNTFE